MPYVLIKGGHLGQTDTRGAGAQRDDHGKRQWGRRGQAGRHLQVKPRREASEETNPADILILDY